VAAKVEAPAEPTTTLTTEDPRCRRSAVVSRLRWIHGNLNEAGLARSRRRRSGQIAPNDLSHLLLVGVHFDPAMTCFAFRSLPDPRRFAFGDRDSRSSVHAARWRRMRLCRRICL